MCLMAFALASVRTVTHLCLSTSFTARKIVYLQYINTKILHTHTHTHTSVHTYSKSCLEEVCTEFHIHTVCLVVYSMGNYCKFISPIYIQDCMHVVYMLYRTYKCTMTLYITTCVCVFVCGMCMCVPVDH